jgi:hypothetical protein
MRSRGIRKSRKIWTQPLCGQYTFWVSYLSFEENDYGSIPLYDFRLDVARRILLGKKCVCDIRNIGGKYGSILYFDSCNGSLLKIYHIVLFYLDDVK